MTATIDSPSSERSTDLLTAVLLGGDFRREHGFWQRLIRTKPFRRPDHRTAEQRLALTYERLRVLNDCLDSAARLAADPVPSPPCTNGWARWTRH